MSSSAIVPVAQRLAEANNVDWRSLQGSGNEGSVVERDVLDYLARVMRGDEATDPTPEPLPEGMSAWPEEPERQRPDSFTAFTVPAAGPVAAPAEPEPAAPVAETSPWSLNSAPETPTRRMFKPLPKTADETKAKLEAEGAAPPTEASPLIFGAPEPAATAFFEPELQGEVSEPPESLAAAAGVPDEEHQAVLKELETLRSKVSSLEAERLKHVGELHQLSRMQETIALQKNESAKLGTLQTELRKVRVELAEAQASAERTQTLEAQNRDLEARLVRARTFRKNAKAEYERLLADNVMLEHEVADLKKRSPWKFWEK